MYDGYSYENEKEKHLGWSIQEMVNLINVFLIIVISHCGPKPPKDPLIGNQN